MYVYLLGTLQCRFLLFIRVGSMVSGSLASCQGSYLSLFLLDVVYVHLYFPTCAVCVCHGYCIILVVVCHYEYTLQLKCLYLERLDHLLVHPMCTSVSPEYFVHTVFWIIPSLQQGVILPICATQ